MLRFVAHLEGEEGQTLAEYGLILVFVSMPSIIALGLLAASIVGLLDGVRDAFPYGRLSGVSGRPWPISLVWG